MKRTCTECGKNIIFSKDTINEVIKFDKLYYHYDCFISTCERKSKKSNASPKWGKALDSIDKIQQETKDYFINCNSDLQKDEVYRFILSNYDIKTVPSYIFIKLDEIYSGKRKGLNCEIPPEDMLDMWKRKMDYLIKLRAKNIALGKNMTAAQQINYDLSVLINKYDSYLKWKEQNKIIEQEVNKVHKDILKTVDLDKLSKITQNQNKEDEDDIDCLLEELFD